jgi:glucosamine-6-phosphate deaminase
MNFQTSPILPAPTAVVDCVKVYAAEDHAQMTDLSARFYTQAVKDGARNHVLPVGRTQYDLFKRAASGSDAALTRAFRETLYIQLDEYLDLPENDPAGLYNTLKDKLLEQIDHPSERRIVFNMAAEPEWAARQMETAIQEAGGIDLALLGLGQNGHIGFNERGTSLESRAHIATLENTTRAQNATLFSGRAIPERAITLGLGTLSEAKSALLMVSGEDKAKATAEFLLGTKSERSPATTLRHMARAGKDVRVIADRAALRHCGL